jgi:hypothetical protein
MGSIVCGLCGRGNILSEIGENEKENSMSIYNHVQEVKNSIPLPIHPGDQIGVCLTCKYWQVEETRAEAQAPKLSICVQPQLRDFALIVSGSSGCDKWQDAPSIAPDADAYAHKGEIH